MTILKLQIESTTNFEILSSEGHRDCSYRKTRTTSTNKIKMMYRNYIVAALCPVFVNSQARMHDSVDGGIQW